MDWGMPVYRRDGRAEFAWANQVRHISLYVMKDGVVAANAERLAGADMGKGCIRLSPRGRRRRPDSRGAHDDGGLSRALSRRR